jgi:alpha-tubulin suppressor-like RCC1 family protein
MRCTTIVSLLCLVFLLTIASYAMGGAGGVVDCEKDPFFTTPLEITKIDTATDIASGLYHTCILLSDGTIQCFGSNVHGELGDGTRTDSSIPVEVIGITTATAITAGGGVRREGHTCALLSDASILCWGDNGNGQLGNGTTKRSPSPVPVTGITTATAIAAGSGRGGHTCAVLSDGTARCWGDNRRGQLGNGTTTSSSTPVEVTGIATAIAIAAGGGDEVGFSCALLSDGTIQCWGSNRNGQLGNGETQRSLTPVPVSGISTATTIAAGGGAITAHACALLSDDTIKCWGDNQSGQLGNGTTTGSSTPVEVTGITTAMAIAAGGGRHGHSCALLFDGTIKCWGSNRNGLLGNGTTTNSSIPLEVTGINTGVAIDASTSLSLCGGGGFSCALLSDGTVKCWGDNIQGPHSDISQAEFNKEKKDSGCFIATAAYGSILAPEVQVLRTFRDNYLTNPIGRSFVRFYYRTSPPIADLIAQHESLRIAVRGVLTPLVYGIKHPLAAGVFLIITLSVTGYRLRRNRSSKQ